MRSGRVGSESYSQIAPECAVTGDRGPGLSVSGTGSLASLAGQPFASMGVYTTASNTACSDCMSGPATVITTSAPDSCTSVDAGVSVVAAIS